MTDYARALAHVLPEWHLLACEPLEGGTSATVTKLTARKNGQETRVVVRQYGDANLRADAEIARHEFELLDLLQREGIAVPLPLGFDVSGNVSGMPFCIVDFVEGAAGTGDVEIDPAQLAAELAKVHRIVSPPFELSSPTVEIQRKLEHVPSEFDTGLNESTLRKFMATHWPWKSSHGDVVLHGDYWPGNTMWNDGRLVAVIDWEDAKVGDPLYDVGNMRLELLWLYGEDAMLTFTSEYHRLMPHLDYRCSAHWDMWAALRPTNRLQAWGLDEPEIARLQRLQTRFVNDALERQRGQS